MLSDRIACVCVCGCVGFRNAPYLGSYLQEKPSPHFACVSPRSPYIATHLCAWRVCAFQAVAKFTKEIKTHFAILTLQTVRIYKFSARYQPSQLTWFQVKSNAVAYVCSWDHVEWFWVWVRFFLYLHVCFSAHIWGAFNFTVVVRTPFTEYNTFSENIGKKLQV